MSDSPWTTDRVIALIKDMAGSEELPAHLKSATIKPEDTIISLGLDSLAAVMVIERLEEDTGEPIPDDFIDMDGTKISDIADRLNKLLGLA